MNNDHLYMLENKIDRLDVGQTMLKEDIEQLKRRVHHLEVWAIEHDEKPHPSVNAITSKLAIISVIIPSILGLLMGLAIGWLQ